MKCLSSKSIIIWRIQATLICAVGIFISGGICVFSLLIGIIATSLTMIVYLLCLFLYIPMLYRNCSYNINSNTISIFKGVILKRKIIIDRKKIQYCELRQTPLQKFYKTAAIKIYTCGTYVIISQLDIDDAKKYIRKAD